VKRKDTYVTEHSIICQNVLFELLNILCITAYKKLCLDVTVRFSGENVVLIGCVLHVWQ